MGRWVTLDDDQKVYVTDSGKIAASRSAISKAGGAKERGKALAARSKAALGNALAKQRNAIATGIGEWNKPGAETERSQLKREISQHLANREHTQAAQKSKQLTLLEKKEGQSPAHPSPSGAQGARRAIEHAKAAGPGQAREMARSQFKVAEKIRTGKMADAALKARYAREDALKAKLGGSKQTAAKAPAAKPGEATVGAGKMVHQGYTKEGLAKFGPEGGKPESSRGESFPGRTTRHRARQGGAETKAKERLIHAR